MQMATQLQVVCALLAASMAAAAESDWTQQCNRCKCVWSSGKKFADCRQLQLARIPADLSGELREIDFAGNPLRELAATAFHAVGLQNVHKLRLDNCSLTAVDARAFQHLQLLIEVSLAHNALQQLAADVFADNGKLRVVSLAGNRLRRLAARTFANLTHLQRLSLAGNRLESIDADVFGANCTLHHLNLQGNRLQHLAADVAAAMPRLNSLDIHGNPWRCDCQLAAFRRLTLDNTWLTTPAECEQPARLRGRRWSDADVVFACAPRILDPPPTGALLEAGDGAANVTLACLVDGTPPPAVAWFMSGTRIAAGGARKYERTATTPPAAHPHWDNLTIINVGYRDRGEYRCVATNAAGNDERNFSLYLHGDAFSAADGVGGGGGVYATSMSDAMLVIVALAVTTAVLLVLVTLLMCYCWRRRRRRASLSAKSRPISEASEFISLDHRPGGGELEKSLLTDVNPVIKPPRQSVTGGIAACGSTDLNDAKKMLMDDDSVYHDDEELNMYARGGRGGSVIGIIGRPAKSPQQLDVEAHYPPDLLAFPPRYAAQISPAGSSASTVADTTRLPVHHISNGMTSPVHAAFFDAPSLYRTLPYARSHSPFAAPHHQLSVRAARPGAYVTIPRRPRMSWSSEPGGGGSAMTPEISEPVYDNLGLRATAKGTSALSLNKLGDVRPLPTHSPLPCTPITEQLPMVATLPRQLHREGLEAARASWARAAASPDEPRSPKTPPRPPPKPKKRVPAGPLFEDEGEDGTEV